MDHSFKTALVIGAGRVGAWVARDLMERGCEVVATTQNPITQRALSCLDIRVVPWKWASDADWTELEACQAEVWCVTVPPRGGMEEAAAFHHELQDAARRCGVKRLIWTSSTAVYNPDHTGDVTEADAEHRLSRHTGVDLLALEKIHAPVMGGDPEFVALRLGGLFSKDRHPVDALMRRFPLVEADGVVQWVHERDAAAACVLAALAKEVLPLAMNVVAPEVARRRHLVEASWGQRPDLPAMQGGGVHRHVRSDELNRRGMTWAVPSPEEWVRSQPFPTESGHWEGPHGRLFWTRHRTLAAPPSGVVLMVHGYKGFKEWGNWQGVAAKWADEGWEVVRMDFSHNGHLPPFDTDCLDEGSWSENHYRFEVEEVQFGLKQLASEGLPLAVVGHSRGGAMAVLGAKACQDAGVPLAGVGLWAPVSNVMARFPSGQELERWQETNRLEVVNGRTGQTLVHPFAFYEDALAQRERLDVQSAAEQLTCPVLVVHGDSDPAVTWVEGRRISRWAKQGELKVIEGADHVFGMRHPWSLGQPWPSHLRQASDATLAWLDSLLS